MNYLIFRTDRIGDFLIISPLLHAIKKKDIDANIFVVSSPKNDVFINKNILADKVFLLKKNNIYNKIILFFKLKKYKFDTIIVSDKKNRSILLTLFLKSKNKIFNVSKNFQKKLLSLIFKNVFLDNDYQKNCSVKEVLISNSKAINCNLEDEDFHYLKKNQFKNNFIHKEIFDLENTNYLIFHYDEKWEIENYTKAFIKASTFTNIEINFNDFLDFLSNLSKKNSKKVIITTGMIKTKIIKNLIATSKKINEFIYEFDLNNQKGYLFINQNFFSISHLISMSSMFISCHGALTHIASIYKIKILDVIEEKKQNHYNRITHHMINYKYLFRNNFDKLSKEIINFS